MTAPGIFAQLATAYAAKNRIQDQDLKRAIAQVSVKSHENGALNVGCVPQKLAEMFFQLSTYAGMPAVNEALAVYKEVLLERGEWPINKNGVSSR